MAATHVFMCGDTPIPHEVQTTKDWNSCVMMHSSPSYTLLGKRDSEGRRSNPINRRGCRYRGVTHHARTNRYESHIWDEGKQIYLGGFYSDVQAALVSATCTGLIFSLFFSCPIFSLFWGDYFLSFFLPYLSLSYAHGPLAPCLVL